MTEKSAIVLLFDGFETLDAFGPVEVFGGFPDTWRMLFCSHGGGCIASTHGFDIQTLPISEVPGELHFTLLPGGPGTRRLVSDEVFLDLLRAVSARSRYTLSVCTGSALLAAAGILEGKSATTNKAAFDWVTRQGARVKWDPNARWVVDGTTFTSSGISAGIDMSLAFVGNVLGRDRAVERAARMEYIWNDNPQLDPFALGEEGNRWRI